jgi:acyl dehydratase
MPFNHDAIGLRGEPVELSWSTDDVLLYALAVGAGQQDPSGELEFTTENSAGHQPVRVLPTFAILLARGSLNVPLGDIDQAATVHAEQTIAVHRPLPAAGTARSVATVTGIYDKGSAAQVVMEIETSDAATGELFATHSASIFVRGAGGFGGDRGPRTPWAPPERPPDHVVTYQTRPEQALLYRLTGDHNPLHSDPAFAARAGFKRPILHGMCTYGYTGRALLQTVCGSDPARFKSMAARFTRPVVPGDELSVAIWVDGDTAYFRTASNGATVLDRGRLTFIP